MKKILVVLILLIVAACNQNEKKEPLGEEKIMTEPDGGNGEGAVSPAVNFARNIEEAHNKELWKKKTAVAFDVDLEFGGKPAFSGKVTSLTNSGKIRIDQQDGTKIVFDGDQVYLCPPTAENSNARFDIFTWQYFFALPFKLTDSGTNWELPEKSGEGDFNIGKLSFNENIGDNPKDWYIVYQEPETGMLHAAAYINTFKNEKEKAEENPHAIVYKDYVVKEGIPIATSWTFHNWNEKDGIGEQIGQAKISNIIFFDAKPELFEKPMDYKIVEK